MEIKRRFLGLMSVSNEASDDINKKVGDTPMTRMGNLRNVFELVIDGLDERPLAEQQFVSQRQKAGLHVFAQACDKLNSLSKEFVKQGLRNVALVTKEFAREMLNEFGNRLTVIDIAW